jgi:hypothetical protein
MRKAIPITVCFALLYMGVAAGARLRDTENLARDSHVVFGSIDYYDQDELDRTGRVTLYLLPATESRLDQYRAPKSEEGVFYWDLVPGKYILVSAMFGKGGITKLHIGAEFEVLESGNDIYIGTIEIHANPLGSTLRIADEYDRISRIYDERFPERAGHTTDRTLEEPRVGNYVAVTNPCAPEWGLTCEDKRFGVIPLTPTVKKLPGLWPTTDNLTPKFTWEASTSEGVTYDFVIYEAVFAAANLYMRGRIFAYVEGLEEPEWQPDESLEPNGRYYWSVRLRRGNEVSAWSTQGFFIFALVAWGSGSGQWFQFKTPKS